MATDRLRVVPANSHRGLPATAALLGCLAGLCFAAMLTGPVMHHYLSATVLLWTVPIVSVILAIAATFVTQRWLMVAMCVATFGGSLALFAGLGLAIVQSRSELAVFSKHAIAERSTMLLAEVAIGFVAGAILGSVALAITRHLVFRTVEQNGLLCWRCGYNTGSERVLNCPECGTPGDPKRFRSRWLHRVVAVGRRIGWAVCLALLLIGIGIEGAACYHNKDSPRSRFVQAMAKHGRVEPGTIYAIGGTLDPQGVTLLVRTPLDASQRLDLLIVHVPPPPRADGAVMQLQVAQTPSLTGGFVACPQVLCNLNAVQAEVVMAAGVPESLKDAMLKASAAISWRGWPLGSALPPNIGVDPTPHFPAE